MIVTIKLPKNKRNFPNEFFFFRKRNRFSNNLHAGNPPWISAVTSHDKPRFVNAPFISPQGKIKYLTALFSAFCVFADDNLESHLNFESCNTKVPCMYVCFFFIYVLWR